jgi:hypothetical protein
MINFPWHVDFGAGVATTLAICAITALSHDQGHTGFHGRFRCCLSSGFPSKIKQSIFVDDAGGDPHDCTALSSAAVAPASHAAAAALCRSIAAWIGSVACAASVGRAPATVTAAVDAAMAPRIDLLLHGLPVDCGTSIADVFVGGVLCTLLALAILIRPSWFGVRAEWKFRS